MPVPWILWGIAGEHGHSDNLWVGLVIFPYAKVENFHDNLGKNEFLLDKLWSG